MPWHPQALAASLDRVSKTALASAFLGGASRDAGEDGKGMSITW